jgi:DNA topoisomerase-1
VEERERARRKRIKEAIVLAAERLGNTPAICRKCYVHPAIFDAYLAGRVVPRMAGATAGATARSGTRLSADERAVLAFLRQQLSAAKKGGPRGTLTQLLHKSVRSARRG